MNHPVLIDKKLAAETKAAIVRAVHDVLDDPDFGLALSAVTRKRLQKARTHQGKNIPLSVIRKKYA